MPLVTRQYGPDAKNSKLSFYDMDMNLYYLQELGVSGFSYSNGTINITNPTGGTKSVTINKVTGFTYNNLNTFTITDNYNNNYSATFNTVTGLTVNGTISATTYQNLPPAVFTGGTVSGSTNFTNGLSANTISATTYQNLPPTVFNGGTVSGSTNFTNGLSANTISATTLTVNGVNITGDIYVTGLTFNTSNYNLTIDRNDGVSFTDSLAILASDLTVTGGTYNPNNGIATFTNNTGGTFNVTGFLTGFTDTYVTGGTYSNGTATFTNTSGGTFDITGFTQSFTGGTVSGATQFTNGLTSNTISATTYQNLPFDKDSSVIITPISSTNTINTLGTNGFLLASNPGSGSPTINGTNYYLSLGKTTYRCSATFGSVASLYTSTTNAYAPRLDYGMMASFKFGIDSYAANMRMFVGLGGGTSAPTNVEPDTLTNHIGICKPSGATNFYILTNDSTGTATLIDLGAGFPANTSQTDVYFLRLWGYSGSVNYLVERYSSTNGSVINQTYGTINTDIPISGTILLPRLFVTNNTSSSQVAFMVNRITMSYLQ